jgi:DNA polymerase III delta subunit
VIEGVERLFAERALEAILDRTLPPAERDLNLEKMTATELDSFGRVEAAIAALPFLGSARVVVVRGAHELRADPRRKLLAAAERVPAGNVLVLEDLVSPASKRPEPLGKLLGRDALRIDTTANAAVRERFIAEQLQALGASAEPAAIDALVKADTDLAATRTDLEKLALGGPRITLEDVLRETLGTLDIKAYQFASAAAAGRTADALALAAELFSTDPRGAAVPLLSALAAEYALLWEAARPGGSLPSKARWRERDLVPLARRLGERRARQGFERAVAGFAAIVTGRADDARLVVEAAAVAGAPPRAQGR